MTESFKTFLLGFGVHVIFSVLLLIVVNAVFPFNINILEAWGFIVLLVMIKTAHTLYYNPDE